MAYVLSFARGLHIYARQQRESLWRPHGEASVVYLPRATALIVGVGNIGAETARLCAALRDAGAGGGRASPGRCRKGSTALHPPEALDSLLPEADFVILTIPHTPSTEGLFDAARFARMKRSAFFVNIGRGMTTRLDALERGPAQRHHRRRRDRRLRDRAPAQGAPPVVGAQRHPDAPRRRPRPGPRPGPRVAVIAENARRFAAGEALLNVVDKASWF